MLHMAMVQMGGIVERCIRQLSTRGSEHLRLRLSLSMLLMSEWLIGVRHGGRVVIAGGKQLGGRVQSRHLLLLMVFLLLLLLLEHCRRGTICCPTTPPREHLVRH